MILSGKQQRIRPRLYHKHTIKIQDHLDNFIFRPLARH